MSDIPTTHTLPEGLLEKLRHLSRALTLYAPACEEAAAEITRLRAANAALERERDAMREALEPFAAAPERGIYGGPMVQAVLVYEDGTDENTKRHAGALTPRVFALARAALKGASHD